MALYGGIEGGGTKFVCIVASKPGDVRAETRFPTTTPAETIGRAIAFFQEQARIEPLAAIGIASFGPVDLDMSSPTYGYVTTTPKPGWAMADFVGPVRAALGIPCAFDTDVNAAALGEFRWGASQGLDPSIYFTIGTGIGAGVIVNGAPVHGLVHPETGHILLPHNWEKDPFPGFCPYHGDCFEGLAAGPALLARWGARAETLPPDHPAWDLEADYIAAAVAAQIYSLSPRKIILGGGVMSQPALMPLVRQKVLAILNNYVKSPTILNGIDTYIVSPGLGSMAGSMGAIALAMEAVK
jgi:fructokinase